MLGGNPTFDKNPIQGGSRNTPGWLMLLKLEMSINLMGYEVWQQPLP